MLLIIKHIPKHIRIDTVENLITPLLKGKFWQKNGNLHSIRIIEITDLKSSFVEHHFIATVSPDEVGNRIIKKLNEKRAFGVSLHVQEYVVRNWRNDRRKDPEKMQKTVSEHTCLRIIDRRRSGLIVQATIAPKAGSFNKSVA